MNNPKANTHPCFNIEAKTKYARIHLPVAPKCNVQCGYCNRKYDCVNESRPGITSAVLSSQQALNYLHKISKKVKNISTIGIAGPGDAFAEPEKTMDTIRKVKTDFPDKIFCISTNGLNIVPYIDELAELDVTHITLTINSFNPETVSKIYNWIRFKKRGYRGIEAAKIIIEQQKTALKLLVDKGITVKINSIIIPGINDHELDEVAKTVSELGASTMNCIPLIPAEGSEFEDFPAPSRKFVSETVKKVSKHIKPMTHCARCRADAAGLIGKDNKDAYKMINECTAMPVPSSKNKPYVAVASHEGIMINKHLGETKEFLIYEQTTSGYKLIENRKAPAEGKADLRWIALAKILDDCSYILVNGVGKRPVEVLQTVGIAIVEMSGLIDDGLDAVFKGKKLKSVIKTELTKCGESCTGSGTGCL